MGHGGQIAQVAERGLLLAAGQITDEIAVVKAKVIPAVCNSIAYQQQG